MTDQKYTISELVERTGFSRRTIRYYVQERLIERPAGRGRGGFYNDSHLTALLRMKAQQERGLSLGAIARLSSAAPDNETGSTREAWARYEIVPGVEIHAARDIEERESRKLLELIRAARSIMKEETVGMEDRDTIWVVVNAEGTQKTPNRVNAYGCKEICDARVEAGADMLYPELAEDAAQLREHDRIVVLQGGSRAWGGQLLVAAGRVKEAARGLTDKDTSDYPRLWCLTRLWYPDFPRIPVHVKGELIILYDLERAKAPLRSPRGIRPRPGDKFIAFHPDGGGEYDELDQAWVSIYGQYMR